MYWPLYTPATKLGICLISKIHSMPSAYHKKYCNPAMAKITLDNITVTIIIDVRTLD